MASNFQTPKQLQIDKANSTVIAVVAVAAFLAAFSLVASKALLSQRAYQSRVIAEKTKALKQLRENNKQAEKLVQSYGSFVAEPINIIGGAATGIGDRDGDNAKIVLDALPSKYDFPAMVTSIEKLLSSNPAYKIGSISGQDDEVAQSTQTDSSKPIEMPFEANMSGDFTAVQDLMNKLQLSIRPIHIVSLEFSGTDANLTLNINARTYYQPERTLGITTKDVK